MYRYKVNVYFTKQQHIPDIADILVDARNKKEASDMVKADFKDAHPHVSVIAVQYQWLGDQHVHEEQSPRRVCPTDRSN